MARPPAVWSGTGRLVCDRAVDDLLSTEVAPARCASARAVPTNI